jgi:methyl coenzyme M reductase beta subunit
VAEEREYEVELATNADQLYDAIREVVKKAATCEVKQSEEGGGMVITLSPKSRVRVQAGDESGSKVGQAEPAVAEAESQEQKRGSRRPRKDGSPSSH